MEVLTIYEASFSAQNCREYLSHGQRYDTNGPTHLLDPENSIHSLVISSKNVKKDLMQQSVDYGDCM